ncbi:MAG: metallophosphoesterase [Lentisphaeria bacterium]
MYHSARQFELRSMAQKPDWANLESAPLFTVAWLSDLHITDETSENLVRAACQLLQQELKPDLTFITGDNCGLPENRLTDFPEISLPLRRQRWLKNFLDREISGRYFLIPGDNWPWEFETVFGAEKRSFSYAGFHFIFATQDQQATSQEGCLIFAADTIPWLKEQLKANQTKPTLLLMHEPIYPPCFLDAPKIRTLLDENSQILGCLGGHLHLDLEFTSGHWKQFCCPAIGRSHRPAFKLLRFTKERIVMTSYEWENDKQKFIQADKWQKMDLPEKFQSGLPSARPPAGFALENMQEMPARPRQKNQELAERFAELTNMNMAFMLEVTLGKLLFK